MSGFRVCWSRVLEDGTTVQVVRGTDGRKYIEIGDEGDSILMSEKGCEGVRFEVRTAADRFSLDMAALELLNTRAVDK